MTTLVMGFPRAMPGSIANKNFISSIPLFKGGNEN
jgi:hypothetical protein